MITVKFVPQSAEFIAGPYYTDTLHTLETAGRTCYASEPQGDPEGFIRRIIQRGHESVLEHCSATMKLVVSRAIQNEIVRHRAGTAYSVQSTRYCNYGKDRFNQTIEVVTPDYLPRNVADVYRREMESAAVAYRRCIKSAVETYAELIAAGIAPETARDVLPLALATPMTVTMNMREWRYFLKLRLDKAAHPQMREICGMILAILQVWYPVLFEDIGECE